MSLGSGFMTLRDAMASEGSMHENNMNCHCELAAGLPPLEQNQRHRLVRRSRPGGEARPDSLSTAAMTPCMPLAIPSPCPHDAEKNPKTRPPTGWVDLKQDVPIVELRLGPPPDRPLEDIMRTPSPQAPAPRHDLSRCRLRRLR